MGKTEGPTLLLIAWDWKLRVLPTVSPKSLFNLSRFSNLKIHYFQVTSDEMTYIMFPQDTSIVMSVSLPELLIKSVFNMNQVYQATRWSWSADLTKELPLSEGVEDKCSIPASLAPNQIGVFSFLAKGWQTLNS